MTYLIKEGGVYNVPLQEIYADVESDIEGMRHNKRKLIPLVALHIL